MVKKGETRKISSFFRKPYSIKEIIKHFNFKVEFKKTKKTILVDYDRLNELKTGENPFTPEPQAKREKTV